MSKERKGFSEEDLRKKGYSPNPVTGTWENVTVKTSRLVVIGKAPTSVLSSLGLGQYNGYDTAHMENVNGQLALKIRLVGLPAGLNGSKGLQFEHWSEKGKRRDMYTNRLKSLPINKFTKPVRITFTRFTSRLMDWDNMCSSFKSIGDGLKHAGIIVDDNASFVIEFIPKQVKCSRKEQHTEILIEHA